MFDGDLDRGLIPREGSGVTTPPPKRTASAKVRAAEVHRMKLKWLACRRGSMSLSRSTRRWEKLSGSCTRERGRARRHPDDQRSGRFLDAENGLVAELTRATGSQRQALAMAGLSRSTWHYRSKPRTPVDRSAAQTDRAYPSRISQADRAGSTADHRRLAGGPFGGSLVCLPLGRGDDAGLTAFLVAHRGRSRINPPARSRRPGRSHDAAEAPVLKATGPGQIWSWDITDLRTPWRGVAFKAYSIIDIYSRKIVGWRVEEREGDDLAVEMFEDAFAEHGLPDAVHADSGPAMRSTVLKDLLADLSVGQTHNRPRVTNDNPFSESEFRTMKYRPNYPGTFADIERPGLGGLVRALVQPATPPHRHRAVHCLRSPQRHLGAGLATTRPGPAGVLQQPTPNASVAARTPRPPAPSSASTSPNKTKPNRLQAA